MINKFSWYTADSVGEALINVNSTVSQVLQLKTNSDTAVFKAGGIDLLDMMKEGLVRPQKIINIKNIEGLDHIIYDKEKGLHIGANVTLSDIVSNDHIKTNYLALHLSASNAGTPQLRNIATIGGNLAQRTRCWYFRSIDHLCLRKGGNICFARNGENRYHAIFENNSCVSIHASSLATALLAFDAKIEITDIQQKKREVPIENFFVLPEKDITKETILEAKEMITAVIIPPITPHTQSYYISQGIRSANDWPLADTAVVMQISDNICTNAVITIGAAAPVPLKLKHAAQSLIGKIVNEKHTELAAEISLKGAVSLSKNSYKIPLFQAIIKRTIMQIIS
jgi:xanthine dehydrogenase YagS FAD-binding subunit